MKPWAAAILLGGLLSWALGQEGPREGTLEALLHPHASPGQPVSLLFRATGPLQGQPQAKLPPSFVLLLPPEETLDLQEGQAENLLLVVQVPSATEAGTYSVILRVGQREAAARITVREVRSLRLDLLDKPVAAVGTFELRFRLQNTGTRKESVSLRVQSNLSQVEALEPTSAQVSPGESVEVRLRLRPRRVRGEVVTEFVRLEALAPGLQTATSVALPILPEPGSIWDRFHTLPATLEIGYGPSGLGFLLRAQGSTAAGRRDRLNLLLRPDEALLTYRLDPWSLSLEWMRGQRRLEGTWSEGGWAGRLVFSSQELGASLGVQRGGFSLRTELWNKGGQVLWGGEGGFRHLLWEEACSLDSICAGGNNAWVLEGQARYRREVGQGSTLGEVQLRLGQPPWGIGLSYTQGDPSLGGNPGGQATLELSRSLEGGGGARLSLGLTPQGARLTGGLRLAWPQPQDRLLAEAAWQPEAFRFYGEWQGAQGSLLRLQANWNPLFSLQTILGIPLDGTLSLRRTTLGIQWGSQGLDLGASLQGGWDWEEQSLTYNLDFSSSRVGLTVTYRTNLALPLYPKAGLGQVQGWVLEAQGQPLAGLYLTLGSLATRTDSEGRFWFPAVPEGEHTLGVLGGGYLTDPPLPLKLSVRAGETLTLTLRVQAAGAIRGRVRFLPPDNPQPGVVYGIPGLDERKLVQGLAVEARQGDQVVRRYTDELGTFTFSGLTPGRWEVRVAFDRFPEAYALQPSLREVLLASGENLTLEFLLRPLPRPILFQEEESL